MKKDAQSELETSSGLPHVGSSALVTILFLHQANNKCMTVLIFLAFYFTR